MMIITYGPSYHHCGRTCTMSCASLYGFAGLMQRAAIGGSVSHKGTHTLWSKRRCVVRLSVRADGAFLLSTWGST
jgi:hypothetical protein